MRYVFFVCLFKKSWNHSNHKLILGPKFNSPVLVHVICWSLCSNHHTKFTNTYIQCILYSYIDICFWIFLTTSLFHFTWNLNFLKQTSWKDHQNFYSSVHQLPKEHHEKLHETLTQSLSIQCVANLTKWNVIMCRGLAHDSSQCHRNEWESQQVELLSRREQSWIQLKRLAAHLDHFTQWLPG